MKYGINGFDDVFKNKNLIQLRKVPRFLREANLESWGLYGLGGRGKFSILLTKLCLSLLCRYVKWSFCFTLHRTML